MRTTIRDLQRMKKDGERIVMLTAYDHPSVRIAERAGVRFILVGDSLGMVVYGHDTTIPVTLDDMVRHAAAVVRGSQHALIVGDLPFMTYATEAEAIASARRLVQEAQVQAVKLEGGAPVVDIVRKLVRCGIPVMAHLGFTPQAQHQLGLRAQAKDVETARNLLQDARALEDAGAFAIVLELVPAVLAEAVTHRLHVPTIGIGAGAGCDGQVQVWHDVLGLGDGKPPRHAKAYAEIGGAVEAAIRSYVDDVRTKAFPSAAQSIAMDEADLVRALG